MSEELGWDEFMEKIDKIEEKKKKHRWRKDATLAFAEEVCELEKTEGRPVYYGEVFYALNKKLEANRNFSQDLLTKLKEHNTKARKFKYIWSVSTPDIINGYKRMGVRISKDNFLDAFSELIFEKLDTVSKWPKGSKIFSSQEPFLYGLMDDAVNGTVFEKMKDGKNETNVALQFARWMLQKDILRKSYLELEYIP